ncbi:hypothetical protein DCC39_18040 [Pueribacillus theae]|uniref:Uncharacterized protein n=1 Tax=Pueribacillus theae TaxID=2171751 RepID=A0A2U1JK26_9BACI|nr:hypothetical protein [Pueribacillus theae]PWA05487.1 hypothetical protein DCC39_18040 [Pueribacillus theae]
MFKKDFTVFEEGIKELADASFSVHDALIFNSVVSKVDENDEFKRSFPVLPTDEKDVVASLATNAILDRPTGNGVNWARVKFEVDAYGVSYTTTGGLTFGWEYHVDPFMNDRHDPFYSFFIEHPAGVAPADRTLRKTFEKLGWKEFVKEDVL